tara:strand:+ start:4889 stop:5689 length:801 start_codon:yes stop_codon:yes gene_type:complete
MVDEIDIITGANGFIGSNLKKEFPKESLILLSRKAIKDKDYRYIQFNIKEDLDRLVSKNIKVSTVFHLAHDFSNKQINGKNINLLGVENLIKFCKLRNAKLVYISSFMAVPAKSEYGKTKLECEGLVRTYKNSLIIRPPVVVNDQGGVFNTINNLFKYLPFFLVPGTGEYNMYSIKVANLVKFIAKTKEINFSEIIYAYDTGPINFTKMLKIKDKFLINVPIVILRILLHIPKILGFKFKSISNNGLDTLLSMPILNFKHKKHSEF